jgi:hypothetical protein
MPLLKLEDDIQKHTFIFNLLFLEAGDLAIQEVIFQVHSPFKYEKKLQENGLHSTFL